MKELIYWIYRFLRLITFKCKWRKNNEHNNTRAECIFDINKVSVGNGTYGNLYIRTFGASNEKICIGNYCSIADGVKFISGGDHPYDRISTFPFASYYGDIRKNCSTSKGTIVVEDDVWIGSNAIILSGVRIGRGSVIAAGAVVTNNIEPYSIVGGVPAKLIKMRFDSDTIGLLNTTIDYSTLTYDQIHKCIGLFSATANEETISKLSNELKQI